MKMEKSVLDMYINNNDGWGMVGKYRVRKRQ